MNANGRMSMDPNLDGSSRRSPLSRHWRWGAAAATLLLLAACADTAEDGLTRPDGVATYKVGKPYQVAGVWYYPKIDYEYDEIGIASWYGEPFHGRATANGEIFDKDEISAAHTTLPMPSVVRVTNLENERILVVRVNDRGPFIPGRIIDLSKAAAEELGFRKNGTAKVRVQILTEESIALASAGQTIVLSENERAESVPTTSVSTESLPPPTALDTANTQSIAPPVATADSAAIIAFPTQQSASPNLINSTQMYVQAGSFLHYSNASALADRLTTMGPTLITRTQLNGQSFYRVLLGPVYDATAANRLLARVVVAGQHDARIIVN
ncbi:MAG: septal ring lytic transglycosylase RlpA family protein [Alphaproteobacteria bacterium]|nr:septal ring lytic transglycosylase RlpA family protein [Alphaproteobacteria bacterium]